MSPFVKMVGMAAEHSRDVGRRGGLARKVAQRVPLGDPLCASGAEVVEQEHGTPLGARAGEVDAAADHVLADLVVDQDGLRDGPEVGAVVYGEVFRTARFL